MISQAKIDQLDRKLDLVVRLLAYQLVSEKTLTHGAPVLRRLGLTASEIAAVFGTTAGAVSVRLSEAKKGKTPKESR